MSDDHIVAVGLLTKRDVRLLGPTFKRLWPVQDTPCFSSLLQAIDEADREIRNKRQSERLGTEEASERTRRSANGAQAPGTGPHQRRA